jgi:hypothetical protein
MLQLLGHGAAFAKPGWGGQAMEAGSICLPAQFKPQPLAKGAKAKLHGARARLLGLFKAGWQQQWLQFSYHCF